MIYILSENSLYAGFKTKIFDSEYGKHIEGSIGEVLIQARDRDGDVFYVL